MPSDARRMRLPRVGRRGMYATSHGGGNRHVSREGGRDNRSILRVSGEQLGAAYGEPAKQPCHPAQTGTVRETRAPPHPTRKRSKRSNGAPRNGKICAPCMIRGVRAAKAAPSWQDLRAVYSQTAVCRAFRMHGARILPRIGDFPVRGPLGDAWSAKLATDRHPGTHRARILPPSDAEERISRAFCHRRAPENAPWQHLATAAPSRMLLDGILPRRPSAARACCEIAVAPRSRKTPPERSVGQFNNARRHVQETMKIFWCLSPRNGTENVLA